MYRLGISLLSGCVLLCQGCGFGVCDAWAEYDVTGQVLDAGTSQPFEDAQISIDLLRNGASVEVWGRPTEVETDEAGEFWTGVTADHKGGLCGGVFGPLAPVEFGDPPNEVQVIVRTSTGARITIAPIDPDNVETEGTILRHIQLPTVEVMIVPFDAGAG